MAGEKTEKKDVPVDRKSAKKFLADRRDILAFFVVALVVRIISLGRADLWCDEILFVNSSMPPMSVGEIFMSHLKNFLVIGHLPLPAMVQNLWLGAANQFVENIYHNPWIQRFPAVIWGSLTVPAFYLMVKTLAKQRVAIIAGLMMCFFFFPVHFSREAYVYAPLLFFGVLGIYYFVRIAASATVTKRLAVPFVIFMLAGLFSHMSGVLLLLSMFLLCAIMLLVNRFPVEGDPEKVRKVYLRLAGLCLITVLPVIPFYYQYISKPSPHHFVEHIGPASIIYDVIGKVAFGTHPVAALGAWVLLISGVIAVATQKEHKGMRVMLSALTLILFIAVMVGSSRTLYFSRYFYICLPGFYFLFAMGVDLLAGKASEIMRGGEKRRVQISWVLTALLLAPQLFLFLPQGYALPAKAVNYGGVARWLEQNLRPGTPYIMESGYELRFVSGYFKTPELVAACPYVHGAGKEEMDRLRQRQAQFMMRFPESAFVESVRHGVGDGSGHGEWTFPRQFYQQEVEIRNEPLEKLASWRIWPQINKPEMARLHISTPIYYNTQRDVENLMFASGQPVMFDYSQWRVRQVAQYEYARVAGGAWAGIGVRNLKGGPLRGKFRIEGVIGAPEGGYPVVLNWRGESLGPFEKWGGSLWSLETEELEIPAGQHWLYWGVQGEGTEKIQGLVLANITFIETPQEPAPVQGVEPVEMNTEEEKELLQ